MSEEQELVPGIVARAEKAGRLMTPDEVAKAFVVSRRRVYEWVYAGRLRSTRVGRSLRFHTDDVRAFLGDGDGDDGS